MKSDFRNKLFIVYAPLIILVFVIAMLTMAVMITRTNRTLEIYHQQQTLDSDVREVNHIFSNMETLASQVAANMELMNFFIPLDSDPSMENYFSTHLQDYIRTGSLLATINSTENSALRISVYNTHGDYISSGTIYETNEAIRTVMTALSAKNKLETDAGSRILISGPHPDRWSDNSDIELFSVTRPLSTTLSSKTYGSIEIQNNVNKLTGLSFWNREPNVNHRLNSEKEPVSACDSTCRSILNQLDFSSQKFPVYLRNSVGTKSVIFNAKTELSDWILLRMIPQKALDEPYYPIYMQLVSFGIGLLLVLLILVYIIADRVSKPLQHFSEYIEKLSLKNLNQTNYTVSSNSSIELQILEEAFSSLLQRLNQSIALEMKAYLQALQSQMNPHFFYNTLSAIIETADEDGSQRTVVMCEKLSAMMRYISDYSSELVPFEYEVENMRNYLDLMGDRYEENFIYTIGDYSSLKGIRIPRMTLQPLTENCFQHGFTNVRPPWHVDISFERDEHEWKVKVRDNGSGVTPEQIRDINHRIEEYQKNFAESYSELRIGGLGLINTVLRLKLAQEGQSIPFEISSNPEGGTTVVIGGRI